MYVTTSVVWGDPDVTRGFLAVAAGLAALAALAIVGTAALGLSDLSEPRHATLLVALQVLVGVGVLLSAANGYLRGGLLVSLALVVAPTLVIVAGMVLAPALGLTTPDAEGLLLEGYFLVVSVLLGGAAFAAGTGTRWVVESVLG